MGRAIARGGRWEEGLVGQTGVVLLRTAADKTGLTRVLGKVFGASPVGSWVDRAETLVYLACAIALGAKNISDVERIAHHHRVLGLSGGTVTARGIDHVFQGEMRLDCEQDPGVHLRWGRVQQR